MRIWGKQNCDLLLSTARRNGRFLSQSRCFFSYLWHERSRGATTTAAAKEGAISGFAGSMATRAASFAGASATLPVARRGRDLRASSGRRLGEHHQNKYLVGPNNLGTTKCPPLLVVAKQLGGREKKRGGGGALTHADLRQRRRSTSSSAARGSAAVASVGAEGSPADDDGPDFVSSSSDDADTRGGKTLRVASYIFGWYFLNAVFAIINKRTLSVFPYFWILSWIQIAVGGAFMCLVWRFRVIGVSPPEGVAFDWKTFRALAPTSALHLVAHVSACASYSLGSVSFMQVVKAGEPACSVILLTLFFGRRYSKLVWLTLLPIVGGVAVGSTTELNFSMASFLCAMLSNVASALRSVTSKDMQDATNLRGVNLYGAMSVVGATMLLPVSLLAEGARIPAAFTAAPAAMTAQHITLFGLTVPFLVYLLTGSMLFHLYNQTSYQALGELQPLDISVANAVKRVVIIIASVAVFRNPITPVGAWSAAVAIFGTFLYSLAAQKQTTTSPTSSIK